MLGSSEASIAILAYVRANLRVLLQMLLKTSRFIRSRSRSQVKVASHAISDSGVYTHTYLEAAHSLECLLAYSTFLDGDWLELFTIIKRMIACKYKTN